jgi:hypothetical protein
MVKNLIKSGIDPSLSSKVTDKDDSDEFIVDYKSLMLRLHNSLDSSIKVKLKKQGITIMQNIYTGFDTEYKHKEGIFNELISVQLAVNTRTILKVPKVDSYYACKIDTLNLYKKYSINKESKINYGLLESTIERCLRDLRTIYYNDYDNIVSGLYKGFKKLHEDNKLAYFEHDDYFVVALPRTPIVKYVYLDEDKKGFSFTDILKASNELGSNYLEEEYAFIKKLLNDINKAWQSKQETTTNNNNTLDVVITSTKPLFENNVKRYSRSLLRSLDVNINRVRNNYIVAHLTAADLSMLNDFDKIKDSLDIVNKSFVTLGKPLLIDNVNVIIRDTMLLAPGGKKSLASLGELLNVEKIKLETRELESMDLLLNNDKSKFVNYAITDAMITLLYANFMEDELFKSRALGIPLSLSSFSATYLKDEWEKANYKGYQIDPMYLIGDTGATQTPKGLFVTGQIGSKISLYISAYKGGRNESFMYGVDNDRN